MLLHQVIFNVGPTVVYYLVPHIRVAVRMEFVNILRI